MPELPFDPTPSLWQPLFEQGALVCGMALLIFFGARWLRSIETRRNLQEDQREARYNQLIDATLKNAGETTSSVVSALNKASAIMERVEKKLDGTH